jgi:hypothetical protein
VERKNIGDNFDHFCSLPSTSTDNSSLPQLPKQLAKKGTRHKKNTKKQKKMTARERVLSFVYYQFHAITPLEHHTLYAR